MNLTRTINIDPHRTTLGDQSELNSIQSNVAYHGPVADVSEETQEALHLLGDQDFLLRAEEHFFLTGHSRQGGAAEQITENGGIAQTVPYFEELFAWAAKDPEEADQPYITAQRLESLFIGAAAFGEEIFAAESLGRLIGLRGGYTQEFESEIKDKINKVRGAEFLVQNGLEGILNGMRRLRRPLTDDGYKQNNDLLYASKGHDRRLENMASIVLPKYMPSSQPRPEDPPVVWRPGVRIGVPPQDQETA